MWDAVAFGIWLASFARRSIRWRGADDHPRLRPLPAQAVLAEEKSSLFTGWLHHRWRLEVQLLLLVAVTAPAQEVGQGLQAGFRAVSCWSDSSIIDLASTRKSFRLCTTSLMLFMHKLAYGLDLAVVLIQALLHGHTHSLPSRVVKMHRDAMRRIGLWRSVWRRPGARAHRRRSVPTAGHVVNAVTGAPLKKATVWVEPFQPPAA